MKKSVVLLSAAIAVAGINMPVHAQMYEHAPEKPVSAAHSPGLPSGNVENEKGIEIFSQPNGAIDQAATPESFSSGTVAGPTGVIYTADPNEAASGEDSPGAEDSYRWHWLPNHPKPDFDLSGAGDGSPDADSAIPVEDQAEGAGDDPVPPTQPSFPKSQSQSDGFESLPPEVNSIAP